MRASTYLRWRRRQAERDGRGEDVLATGARDVGVRLRLQKAVQTVLGIENARIDVSPMEEASGGMR